MKDILQDIIAHTHALGFLSMLKITAEKDKTIIESIADDKSIVMSAETAKPVDAWTGVFGMADLHMLSYHIKNPEYEVKSKIEVVTETRNGEVMPTHIHFENATGDFENDYRFIQKGTIETKLKSVKFKGAGWDIEFDPTKTSIDKFKRMATGLTDEVVFHVKLEKGNLNFYFGDQNVHAGNFTFHSDITANFKETYAWPVKQVLAILNLGGKTTMRLSNQGAMKISVNSNLATYEYILPAHQK